MKQYESTDRVGSGGVSDRPLAGEDQTLDWSQVLARIPDVRGRLNRKPSHRPSSGKRGKGKRLISPRMSVGILVAGGAALLAIAMLSSLFRGGDSDDSTSTELASTTDAASAPKWDLSQSTTPTGPVEVAAAQEQFGTLPGESQSLRVSPASNTGPAAVSGRSGALMPSGIAADYRPGGTTRYLAPDSTNSRSTPTADVNRSMEIGKPRPDVDAGNRTADRRAGLPAASAQPVAVETSAWPRRDSATVKASYRPGSTTSYPAPTTATRQSAPNAVMDRPSPNAVMSYPAPDTATRYPTPHTTTRYPVTDRYQHSPSQPSPSAPQPGVARFEGGIQKPVIRTTDERARPSFH